MDERKVNIVTCLILVAILVVTLGGFAYAYLDKVYMLNQTENYFQSLGFEIINMPADYNLYVRAILSVVDVASFVSIGRQYNITTILESGYSFYLSVSQILYRYTYTPSNSTWWIWK
jgi:hypothetical protein